MMITDDFLPTLKDINERITLVITWPKLSFKWLVVSVSAETNLIKSK